MFVALMHKEARAVSERKLNRRMQRSTYREVEAVLRILGGELLLDSSKYAQSSLHKVSKFAFTFPLKNTPGTHNLLLPWFRCRRLLRRGEQKEITIAAISRHRPGPPS